MYLALLGLFIIFHIVMSILVWLLLDGIFPILLLRAGNGAGKDTSYFSPFRVNKR